MGEGWQVVMNEVKQLVMNEGLRMKKVKYRAKREEWSKELKEGVMERSNGTMEGTRIQRSKGGINRNNEGKNECRVLQTQRRKAWVKEWRKKSTHTHTHTRRKEWWVLCHKTCNGEALMGGYERTKQMGGWGERVDGWMTEKCVDGNYRRLSMKANERVTKNKDD